MFASVFISVIGGGEVCGGGCSPAAETPFASRFGAFSVQKRWRGLTFRREGRRRKEKGLNVGSKERS